MLFLLREHVYMVPGPWLHRNSITRRISQDYIYCKVSAPLSQPNWVEDCQGSDYKSPTGQEEERKRLCDLMGFISFHALWPYLET